MRNSPFSTFLILALTVALNTKTNANAGTASFDDGVAGAAPVGWQPALAGEGNPKWMIEQDASAPSPSLVLRQSGWTPKPGFPICVCPEASLKNGFVEVKFKPLSGTNDQAAGVVWRLRDANNYYVARANALENNVVLYKVERGKRTALDVVGRRGGYGVAAEVPTRQWSTLKVTFSGARFEVFLNARRLFAVEDTTFSGAGHVGVWTKADSVTSFDDFSWGED
jgi:hypothetical protein